MENEKDEDKALPLSDADFAIGKGGKDNPGQVP